jgi:hypothetical protein
MAESILHYAGATFRINGTGFARLTLMGLDRVKQLTLGPITMATSPGFEPTRKCNFTSQRTLIRMETTDIDEYMKVNRIVLWVKELYTEFPASRNS